MTGPRQHRAPPRLAQWHLRVGIASAVVLVALAATGLVLNHGRDLGLESRYLRSSWLLDWYGIAPPRETRCVATRERFVCELDGRVFLDAREIEGAHGRLKGAVALGDVVAVVVEDRLWLLTAAGAVIEELGAEHGLPQPVRALGEDSAGRLVLDTGAGHFVADEALLGWRRIAARATRPVALAEAPPALRERLDRAWRERALNLERVVADAHSGRLFGRFGVWIVDLTGIAALVLSVSGPWLWLARRRRDRHKRRAGS